MLRPDISVLPLEYQERAKRLFTAWNAVESRNANLKSYYNMKNVLIDLGIDVLPLRIKQNLNSVVGWCSKAIHAHAMRSVFDGYVFAGQADAGLDKLVTANRLRSLYQQAWTSALTYGISAVTVMRGSTGQPKAKVRVFSANQFSVLWDNIADRIGCGVVLSDVDKSGNPTRFVFHFPDVVIDMFTVDDRRTWKYIVEPHALGRPLMDVFVNEPDPDRPLGHSMITPELISIVDKAVRDLCNMEVGATLFTYPQRYMIGVSEGMLTGKTEDEENEENEDEESKEEIRGLTPEQKFKAYFGAMLAISRDENGDVPQVGQFAAGNAENFTRVFENDAQRFSGATNVPLSQLGVLLNTYTSSDALGAANNPLILEVEAANRRNSETLETIGRMIMAVAGNTTLDALTDEQKGVQAYMRDPSMPTISARADAWTKLAASDPSIAGTRVFYEGVGLSQPTIDRLMAEKRKNGAISALNRIADGMGV